ncbi:MAG: molybdopterin-guanine dinucleotide biosynthesis protein B [Oscillospiraceae bacterium]|jgi:molybdopterin-guanine dinucleotide biosynthesis protein MobB|nr:molybdopterin-guanine dinucleotide biosynthesis protein B [Oscillospiraceae bacterium]
MAIPVYSVVAYSGTGKTTLLEKLVPELKSRGLRVAVIKHDAHKFDIDHEGKDSWRMTRAGADVTIIASSEKSAFMENRYVPFETLVERVTDVDVILTEGYKTGNYPKIALRRAATGNDFAAEPDACFAVMSDAEVETTANALKLDDAAGLADLIVTDIKKHISF